MSNIFVVETVDYLSSKSGVDRVKVSILLLLTIVLSPIGTSRAQGLNSVPTSSLYVNPYSKGTALPWTTGNSSTALVSESQVNLPDIWRILFQPQQGATHDALSATVEPMPGTTSVQVNAISGYVYNRNSASQTQLVGVGVALGGYTINAVDGAQSWGLDLIQTDAPAANGRQGRLLQNEADFKPLFENTAVNGFILTMDTPTQPITADGWICGKTAEVQGVRSTGVGRWNHCVITYPGSAVTAVLVGAASLAGTELSDSQNVDFQVTDDRGAFHSLRLRATNDRFLVLQRDDGGRADLNLARGSLLLQTGENVYIDGRPIVGGPVPETATTPCSAGALTSDSAYIYSCVAKNTWKRVPLSSW